MSLKVTYPFDNSSNYNFDSSKIVVSNSIAKLKLSATDPYAYYSMQEGGGLIVKDISGNSRNGSLNKESWTTGKIGNCINFDGDVYVDCGDICNFERDQPFSVECWFKTSYTNYQVISGRYRSGVTWRGWYILLDKYGRVSFNLNNDYPIDNRLEVYTTEGFNDGAWHHLFIVYDGSSKAEGVKIYVDGLLRSLIVVIDNLSGSITENVSFLIGNRERGDLPFHGLLDEFIIYDRIMSPDYVAMRYNSGNGQFPYSTSNPIIYPKSSIRTDEIISLSETSTKPSGTDIKYIIKVTDTDYYWNGSNWAQSDGSYSQSNTINEINNNLSNFPGNPSEVYVKAMLHSDGFDSPELDKLEVDYDYAGSDRDDITVCAVTGWITDIANSLSNIDSVPITVNLCRPTVKYKSNVVLLNETKTFYSNSYGYFELKLIENENMESDSYYVVSINKQLFRIKVPNQAGCNFLDIII